MIPPFETTFAVPLSCEDCIKDVSGSLYKLNGINRVDADLAKQLISVEGTVPPSAIVEAIQATGRDAILRGSGKSDSAAVCILESHAPSIANKVKGLARMVQVAPNLTIIDLSIRGLSPGTYQATIRERGDISDGPASTGGIWEAVQAQPPAQPRGLLGTVHVGASGVGSVFWDRPIQIWEVIGRSMVLSPQSRSDALDRDDPDTLVGVIARSAGVWDNDKTVCSCSGKTVWEERVEQVGRGML